jgi:transposase
MPTRPYLSDVRNIAVALMRSGMSVSDIETTIGIPRSTAYRWRRDDALAHLAVDQPQDPQEEPERLNRNALSVRKEGRRLIVEIDLD